ncbi:MAG: bifunctional hydroxymethylpyrimidine kinase/phosphomethylpyrimidine kinase [Deltaproteobacteria bacterium HGW-Deltaproteobacteria-22]|nr:MAG: bifunctional hydroxymethylpyrimidine kinase/phosphomethylpyrimidine kinase [Deltaproteobacteria bacterium HGW-Deltaproteobacteria-22]
MTRRGNARTMDMPKDTNIPEPVCLIIAGYDPSGGGGVLADLRAARACGVRAVAAVTAVTAQNTFEIARCTPVDADLLRDELDLLAREFSIRAVKVGMLGNAALAGVIAEFLDRLPSQVPVVLDPVLAATAGMALFEPDQLDKLTALFSRCALITPNLPELARLTGLPVDDSPSTRETAARSLLAAGARAVLVKGGHADGAFVVDDLFTAGSRTSFEHPRLELPKIRGTGCFLSTAIACGLLCAGPLPSAISSARTLLQDRLGAAWFPGGHHGLLPDSMD